MQTILKFYCLICLVGFCCSSPLRESQEDLNDLKKSEKVKFYLYAKSNPDEPQQIFKNNEESVKNSNFNPKQQTRIIIHGWLGSYTNIPNGPIREAYLSQGDYNIISVDWHDYAKLNYVSARNRVSVVGEEVAELVDFLNEKFQMSFDSLVVIGHSLGAHVAGFCGKSVKRGKLSYIVGLDPANPLFDYDKPDTRLSSTDAKYVETIQTNGNVQGYLQPIGTAAFYANWGRLQPGCGIDLAGRCSHARCVYIYAEAIRGYKFTPIYKCDNFDNILQQQGCDEVAKGVELGDPTQIEHKPGIYYFETNSEEPLGHL